jgi:hypothetical protein
MDVTRTAPRLESTHLGPRPITRTDHDDGTVADLTARLAQDGVELITIELRRIRAEVRGRQRHAVRAGVALYLGAMTGAVGTAVLAVAAVLYLGPLWGSYAAAALATGAVLVVVGAVAAGVLFAALRRLAAPSGRAGDERSTGHGT